MTDEILFPPHKGWEPFAPTRSLPPDGPGYRDMQNFRIGDEFLKRRAMVDVPVPSQLEQPSTIPAPGNAVESEWPVHLWADNSLIQQVSITITNLRVLLGNGFAGSTIETLNPVVDSGLGASATVGSTLVTGVNDTPNKYPILVGQILMINLVPVGIVASYNGALNEVTLKEPALATVAGSWQVVFSIIRQRSHFRVYNGDLYVAALWEDLNANPADGRDKWGVMRWTGLKARLRGEGALNPTWLVANAPFDGDPNIAADSPPAPAGPPPPYRQVYNNPNGNQTGIPNNLIDHDTANVLIPGSPVRSNVKGLDLLQDGRVVCPVSSSTYDDRVFYSSQINDPQIHWNTSPGGFVDPVGIEGELEVMGRLGNQLTLHYEHGIAVATPTGQDDPPLAFQATRERQGCTFWRTLVNISPAIEVYLGPDYQLHSFNGSAAETIGAQTKVAIPGAGPAQFLNRSDIFASWDGYQQEVSLWRWNSDRGPREETYRAVFNFEKGAWTKDFWQFFITAVSRDYGLINSDPAPYQDDRSRYAIVGMTARNTTAPGPVPVVYQGILGYLGEKTSVEHVPPWITEPVPPSFVELDNFGLGLQTINSEYVGLEIRGIGFGGTEDYEVLAIFDANPVPAEVREITIPAPGESLIALFQEFNNNSGEKVRFRVSMLGNPVSQSFNTSFGVIRLGVDPVGEVRSEGQDVP